MTQDQAKKVIEEISQQIMVATNNVGVSNSKEFDALVKAGIVLQEYLEKNG